MIKLIINKIINKYKFIYFKIKWKKVNSHNYTTVGNYFPIDKASVGIRTYGRLNVKAYSNENEYLKIGSYCSIGGDVKFLLGGEHSYKNISTYPFEKFFCHKKEDTITKGPIIVHDDVWIGENSIILSGVKIGQGAVIGAGSVVAKDIPPYGIYVNGKVIKFRFSEAIINKLVEIDFSKIKEEDIIQNIDKLYETIDDKNIDFTLDTFFKS